MARNVARPARFSLSQLDAGFGFAFGQRNHVLKAAAKRHFNGDAIGFRHGKQVYNGFVMPAQLSPLVRVQHRPTP